MVRGKDGEMERWKVPRACWGSSPVSTSLAGAPSASTDYFSIKHKPIQSFNSNFDLNFCGHIFFTTICLVTQAYTWILVITKDYKLRGLDTRQRRPQKWRYKPNYSILTQVFLDLPQLLQSSTDRAEYRQTKHINQCSRHTFQSVFIDYPRQPHIHTGSDFSQLWIVCFVLKPRLRKS